MSLIIPPSTKTLYEYLEEANEQSPDRILLIEAGKSYTTREIYQKVNEYGCWLSSRGFVPGELLSLRMTRTVDSVCYFLAALAIGLVVYASDEHQSYEDFLKNADALHAKAYLSDETGKWILWEEGKEKEEATFEKLSGDLSVQKDALKPALLILTSGSTGESKIVAHSQFSVINNLTDAYHFGDYREDDLALGILPFSHIFGLVLLFGAFVIGYGIAFPNSLKIDDILACISDHRVSRINSVPSLYLALARKAADYDVSSVRVGFIGGAPYTKDEFARIEEGLDMKLIPCYGMSECPSISIHQAKDSGKIRIQGVGQSYFYSSICVKDEAGLVLKDGEIGEICVKSATLMLGYFEDGRYLLDLDEDGFFHTGDLGYLDEKKHLFITGRIKDIIIRNGNNIALRKIEEAFLALDGVEEAAVLGKEDAECGEVPVAFVKSTLTKDVIFEGIATTLVKNELPVDILYLEEFPKTSSGKTDRQKLISVMKN